MKKIKRPGNLNGFGIGVAVVMAAILFVRAWMVYPEEPVYMRLATGALSCFLVFIGSAVIWLAMMFAYYAASKINEMVFVQKEEDEDDPLDTFTKSTDVLFTICIIAAYIIVFIHMKR